MWAIDQASQIKENKKNLPQWCYGHGVVAVSLGSEKEIGGLCEGKITDFSKGWPGKASTTCSSPGDF